MGFVLTGTNLGLLIGPFLFGMVYERVGYYAVFGVGLGIIGFDLLLRVTMIEKRRAAKWFEKERHDDESNPAEPDSALPENRNNTKSKDHWTERGNKQAYPQQTEHDEASPLIPRTERSRQTWFARTFPTMSILLGSPRLWAALFGCVMEVTITTIFDGVLPLFVKRTFHWNSSGAGLIFIAITIPAVLGPITGAASDRYGPRIVALLGFALTAPACGLLGLVQNDSMGDKVLLCLLLFMIGDRFRYS